MSAAQNVVGEDAVAAYQEDLDTYDFYEDVNGYDFEEMKQTLLENKSVLWNVKQTIIGADAKSLREAAKSLRMEGETVHEYSFHGLKLDYGEMSLAGDLYDGIEDVISDEVASGFLGFLTDKELSDKTIDTAYLPSGFRSGETDFTILSLLGTDMSGVFGEMQGLLPESKSLGEAMDGNWIRCCFIPIIQPIFPIIRKKRQRELFRMNWNISLPARIRIRRIYPLWQPEYV